MGWNFFPGLPNYVPLFGCILVAPVATDGATKPPEKQTDGSSICINIQTKFGKIEKPMLHTNQILLPLQAQQLGRSYGVGVATIREFFLVGVGG